MKFTICLALSFCIRILYMVRNDLISYGEDRTPIWFASQPYDRLLTTVLVMAFDVMYYVNITAGVFAMILEVVVVGLTFGDAHTMPIIMKAFLSVLSPYIYGKILAVLTNERGCQNDRNPRKLGINTRDYASNAWDMHEIISPMYSSARDRIDGKGLFQLSEKVSNKSLRDIPDLRQLSKFTWSIVESIKEEDGFE